MAAASLIWNVVNTWLTHRLSNLRTRREFHSTEFDTLVRAPVMVALNNLAGVRLQLRGLLLANDAGLIPGHAKEMQIKALIPAYHALDVSIGRVESLPDFAGRVQLKDLLEARYDAVIGSMQEVYDAQGIDGTSSAINRVCANLHKLDVDMHARLNQIAREIAKTN
jgi:hypothetical protein